MPDILRRVGPWELERTLGAGRSTVYLAHLSSRPTERAAVKLLRIWLEELDEHARIRHEYQALARLSHPGIVPLFPGEEAFGEKDGQHWLAMMWIDGPTLEERRKQGPLPPGYAAAMFYSLVDALEYAHLNGVFHRDVKPANIIVGAAGPKLVDFGVALQIDRTRLTAEGCAPGTLPYMAPELLFGGESSPQLSDLYALGITLFEALTGRRAFPTDPGLSDRERLGRVLAAKQAPKSFDPGEGTPEPLREVVRGLTDPDTTRRLRAWGNARSLLARVPPQTDPRPEPHVDPSLPPDLPPPAPPRTIASMTPWMFLAAVVALVPVIGLLWYLHETGGPAAHSSTKKKKTDGVGFVFVAWSDGEERDLFFQPVGGTSRSFVLKAKDRSMNLEPGEWKVQVSGSETTSPIHIKAGVEHNISCSGGAGTCVSQ